MTTWSAEENKEIIQSTSLYYDLYSLFVRLLLQIIVERRMDDYLEWRRK